MKEPNYQDLKKQLDELTAWFESDDIDVDEAIKKYQQAVDTIKKMEKLLDQAELSVKKISDKAA